MSDHHHYWIAYSYRSANSSGMGCCDYILDTPKISIEDLGYITKYILKTYEFEVVAITFFAEVDCACGVKDEND